MWTQENLIKVASKSVPAFKWIIGAAAIFGLAAIILKGGINLATSILVVGILLVLAVALMVLNWVSKLRPGETSSMALFMAWSFLLILVASVGCIFLSAVADWPWPIRSRISEELFTPRKTETSKPPAISELAFPKAETFPSINIKIKGGTIDANILVAKIAVNQVWETKTIWSYSGAPAGWSCDVVLPVLGAPYEKTISIERTLKANAEEVLSFVLGSDAHPFGSVFIYDAKISFVLADGTTLETKPLLFFGRSAVDAISGSNGGDRDATLTRNLEVVDVLKRADHQLQEEVARFIRTYSADGVSELLPNFENTNIDVRKGTAHVLGLYGHRAFQCLPEIEAASAKEIDYLVREEIRHSLDLIRKGPKTSTILAIPDPKGTQASIESFHNPPDFLKFTPTPPKKSYEEFTARDWLNKGDHEWRRGDLAEAAKSLDKCIAATPEAETLAGAYFTRGFVNLELKQWNAAVDDFTKNIEIYKQKSGFEYDWSYRNRGNALKRLGRFADAAKDYDKAVELGGKRESSHWLARGHLRVFYLGMENEGIADLRKAVEMEPFSSSERLELAETLIAKNRIEEAEIELNALQIVKDTDGNHVVQCVLWSILGELKGVSGSHDAELRRIEKDGYYLDWSFEDLKKSIEEMQIAAATKIAIIDLLKRVEAGSRVLSPEEEKKRMVDGRK